jgi:hypothetical protein
MAMSNNAARVWRELIGAAVLCVIVYIACGPH